MAYTEWIKRGRDPVFPREFYGLSGPQATAFVDHIANVAQDRVEQLALAVGERRPDLKWRPDFTEAAFVALGEAMVDLVDTAPRNRADIEEDLRRQKTEQPGIMALVGDSVREWEPTDRTLSIIFDAGIYFGQDLIRRESRLRWVVDRRMESSYHHPVIAGPRGGRKAPFVFGCPISVFITRMSMIANKELGPINEPSKFRPAPVPWSTIYREWTVVYLGGYFAVAPQHRNPRDGACTVCVRFWRFAARADPDRIRPRLQEAVESAGVGEALPAALDKLIGEISLPFRGPSARALVGALRDAVRSLRSDLPEGWYSTIRYDDGTAEEPIDL